MKKRLRKKKHRDEFAEWGRRLVIKRNRKDGFDDFLDNFIREAIEANGCYCGGAGEGDNLDVIVELGCRSNDPDAKVTAIAAWLTVQPDIQGWKISEAFDLWNGNFEEIEYDVQ